MTGVCWGSWGRLQKPGLPTEILQADHQVNKRLRKGSNPGRDSLRLRCMSQHERHGRMGRRRLKVSTSFIQEKKPVEGVSSRCRSPLSQTGDSYRRVVGQYQETS
jgi:hypothetical protein